MRTFSKLLLTGLGLVAAAGAAYAADKAKVMNVALPDGSVARISYVGDIAPRVIVAPAPVPIALIEPSPFALFDRIAADMDRQMATMLREASMLSAAPNTVQNRAALPAGTVRYSFTSFSSGNGAACSQSVQVTSLGENQPPKVVRQSSGDCSAMNARAPIPAVEQARPAAPAITPVVYAPGPTSHRKAQAETAI